MTHVTDKLLRIGLMAVAGIGCLFGGDMFSPTNPWVTKAHAVIGRPLTPMSYAGVARRTTSRAVVATGAMAATAAPVVVAPAPACVQVVNAYGQITYRCP